MLKSEFDKIVREKIEIIKSLSESKAKEYATKEDRLHNFKSVARMNDESPERSLWGMVSKHVVAIRDNIKRIEKGLPLEDVKKYIDDNLVYLVLLQALFDERRKK